MVRLMWVLHVGRRSGDATSIYGLTGERPTHPELLEYLASRFVESGWSMKAMHREIMLSAAYQSAYERKQANEAKDPDNRLLWHANFRRLEVEPLRDSMLLGTRTLDERLGGPPQNLNRPNCQ